MLIIFILLETSKPLYLAFSFFLGLVIQRLERTVTRDLINFSEVLLMFKLSATCCVISYNKPGNRGNGCYLLPSDKGITVAPVNYSLRKHSD